MREYESERVSEWGGVCVGCHSVHARWKFERLERSTELTAEARAR